MAAFFFNHRFFLSDFPPQNTVTHPIFLHVHWAKMVGIAQQQLQSISHVALHLCFDWRIVMRCSRFWMNRRGSKDMAT